MFKIVKVRYSNNPCDFCFYKVEHTFSPGRTSCERNLSPSPQAWRGDKCREFLAKFELGKKERKTLREAFMKID